MIKVIRYILFLFLITFFIVSCTAKAEILPFAKKGVINLTKKDLILHENIKLIGEWEFYKSTFITKLNNSNTNKTFIQVPGNWKRDLSGKKLLDDGYGTYHLRVILPENSNNLALKFFDIPMSYKLYVNRKIVGSVGKIGKNFSKMKWGLKSSIYKIGKVNGKCLDIVVQVSSFRYITGGIITDVILGDYDNLIEERNNVFLLDFFLVGSFFIIALYYLILFFIRKEEKSTLYFSLFTLLIALRTLIVGEMFFYNKIGEWLFPVMFKFDFLTMYLGLTFFWLFIFSLFPTIFSKKIFKVILFISLFFSLIVVVAPAMVFTHTLYFFHATLLLALSYMLFVLIKAIKQHQNFANMLLFGFLFLFLTIVNDVLYANSIIFTTHLVSLGLFIFIFSQAVFLSLKFSTALKKIEILSEDVSRKSIQLEIQNSKLLQLDKLKDDFLANISHELKTPLHGIIGISDSIINLFGKSMPNFVIDNLKLIISSGNRLSRLVNDIMDYSELRHGTLLLNKGEINLNSMVEYIISLLTPLLKEKDVEIQNRIPDNFPHIVADGDRLEQIFYNLIGNSIKFIKEGHIIIDAVEDREKGVFFISISDTGIGIPDDKLEEIFHSFKQLNLSVDTKKEGSGLGLAITKNLIELHGGEVRVISQEKKGSVFIFSLPIIELNDSFNFYNVDLGHSDFSPIDYNINMDNVTDNFSIEEKENNRVGKILVVDDEPVNRQILVNILSSAGYKIFTFSSGKDALDFIDKEKKIDIVLLDVMMPVLSGYEVCKRIREKFSLQELPVILLTVKNRASDIVTGFESGANDYVTKPFDKQELLSRVNNLVALKKSVSEHNELSIINGELKIAYNILFSSLPEKMPKMKGFFVGVGYEPMFAIGGDYYDFYQIDENRLGVFIADVSGHGVAAALIASMLKIAFSIYKNLAKSPAELISHINDYFFTNLHGKFITLGYSILDFEKMEIAVANAGHFAPLLVNRDSKNLREATVKGHAIGLSNNYQYETKIFPLLKQDRIVFFTDGIIESRNNFGEIYSLSRFYDFIKETVNYNADRFVDTVLNNTKSWLGDEKVEDDITLICIDLLDS